MSPHIGDIANYLSLVLTFAFLLTYFIYPKLFAESYLDDGFCVSWKDSTFNSHMLCFYVDSICAALLLGLCYIPKRGRDATMSRVKENSMGIFSHGVGHLSLHFMANELSAASAVDAFSVGLGSPLLTIQVLLGILFFWTGFFWSFTKSKVLNLTLSAVNTGVFITFVPIKFGFTYVQTVLMTCFVTRELFLPKEQKDFWYSLWAVLVPLPVVLVGWLEAISCDSFLKALGGHVYYDGIIPLSTLVFAAMALTSAKQPKKIN